MFIIKVDMNSWGIWICFGNDHSTMSAVGLVRHKTKKRGDKHIWFLLCFVQWILLMLPFILIVLFISVPGFGLFQTSPSTLKQDQAVSFDQEPTQPNLFDWLSDSNKHWLIKRMIWNFYIQEADLCALLMLFTLKRCVVIKTADWSFLSDGDIVKHLWNSLWSLSLSTALRYRKPLFGWSSDPQTTGIWNRRCGRKKKIYFCFIRHENKYEREKQAWSWKEDCTVYFPPNRCKFWPFFSGYFNSRISCPVLHCVLCSTWNWRKGSFSSGW